MQPKAKLTRRQQEVLALVAEGWTNEDIAKQLCLVVATVETHLRHIRRRLEAKNRTHAAVIAIRRGLLP